MIALDENALICDFASSYHIFDYRSLPCKTAAALAFGLGENSRIKKKMMNIKATNEEMLLAAIADRVGELEWMQTKDGTKGRNRPKSILMEILKDKEETTMNEEYDSGEEFDRAWSEAVGMRR